MAGMSQPERKRMLVTTVIVALALAGIAMVVNAVVQPGSRKRSDQSQQAVPAPRAPLVFGTSP